MDLDSCSQSFITELVKAGSSVLSFKKPGWGVRAEKPSESGLNESQWYEIKIEMIPFEGVDIFQTVS